MSKFQKFKYTLYFITGVFCIINIILWWNTFTIFLSFGGLLLTAYSLICFKKKENIFKDFPKIFHYACRVLVSAFIISFLIIEGLVIAGGTIKDDIKTDYIVVLGAAIKEDKPSLALSYRLDEAYDHYTKNPSALIICSGGKAKGQKYSEAEVMSSYLQSLGVPKKQIILEDNSFSTQQNLENSYKIVDDKDATFLIVTNNFHAFRANMLARRIGMNAFSSSSQKLYSGFTANYIREYFSFIKAFVFS